MTDIYTPRVSPDALNAALANGLQGPVIIASGSVHFNATTDAAIITFGQSKDVSWNDGTFVFPGNPITPGPLCAFGVYYCGSVLTGTVPALYDACAEVRLTSDSYQALGTQNYSDDIATAWLWDASNFTAVVGLLPTDHLTDKSLLIAYEGVPVAPALRVRCGMIPTVSPADADVTHYFLLYALPVAAFGDVRVHVPSPWCVPPFMPTGASKGTHLFSQHTTHASPLGQASNVRRMFRPVTWTTAGPIGEPSTPLMVVDARIYGGPWNAHVLGVKPTADPVGCTWDIEEMLRTLPAGMVYAPPTLPYNAPVLATANNSASIYTPRPVDALRITLEAALNTTPRTDVLLTYPQ